MQVANVLVWGSAVALPSSTPYGVIAAQTFPVMQVSTVSSFKTLPSLNLVAPPTTIYGMIAPQTFLVMQVANVIVQYLRLVSQV